MAITQRELRRIEKECREEAREIIRQEYAIYDEIWYGRIRLTPAVEEHGKEVVKDLIRIMPNLLVRNEFACPLDLVADRYGFETTSALIDYLLAYTPRGPKEERLFEKLLTERLAAYVAADNVDDVPF
ncbi:MAG: iron receptor [Desulfovibrio sp.]|nr:iron receptor [Desulfovibrio sp.]